ncbi:hypothetical protein Aca07nite_49230 [Actinoplanes capillaceus]|uniref:Uncharacterized protein n=1 Tax=Actinoplanes campanulatus TaxID=113559 RepID=A0ABQ3WN37_9ACTN|nr:hypothetical protein GCM10010109_57450 [Actinoplanes campanulatus]GID38731.1 hypothetical protein Aca09nite_52370 [Actinoplanes campanulatus]GID47648.1 hypothetical protein Aca07nite_49230 [Actinoplanes capillaceus]
MRQTNTNGPDPMWDPARFEAGRFKVKHLRRSLGGLLAQLLELAPPPAWTTPRVGQDHR